MGDHFDRVFIHLHAVRHGGQRVELHAEFVLGRGDFMVVFFRLQAELFEDGEHFCAHVLAGIDRIDRKIATLWARAVTHIAAFIMAAGVLRHFLAID